MQTTFKTIFTAALLFVGTTAALTTTAQTVGWTTSGTKILAPNGSEFNITGINWYGFETRDQVAHGLWSVDYTTVVDQVKLYGYNTIRIAFSNEMWESNPSIKRSSISACSACQNLRARDIMALIINYAGSVGLHIILDNHRSGKGNSAEGNGLWYTGSYPEQNWINDWTQIQAWVNGVSQPNDTVTVNSTASDGFATVLGFDLRNEPHTPARTDYLDGATWGTGDGIDPNVNPNPNPFTPACVATSTCRDWRLAAERAGTTLLGQAAANNWSYPLIFVEGTSTYPADGGTPANGPYDGTWWGGNLLGVNGNSTNPGAPVLLNAGGNAFGLGPAVANQVVYSAHDYGPELYQQPWFNSDTCYQSGCSTSSLTDLWHFFWAYINTGEINPAANGGSYPWGNTGHSGYTTAPLWIGEFGTPNQNSDLYSSGPGSQGQWFTALVNFIDSSFNPTPDNDSGYPVDSLHFTYWSLNGNDNHGLLDSSFEALANDDKEYSFLCFIQWGPVALPQGTAPGECGSTGPLPVPAGGGGNCTATSIHVGAITLGTQNAGQGNKRGSADVTIVDDCGDTVADAGINGTFSGDFNETATTTTGSNGTGTLVTQATAKGNVSFGFCVDNATHATLSYDSSSNVVTCQ